MVPARQHSAGEGEFPFPLGTFKTSKISPPATGLSIVRMTAVYPHV